MDNQRGIRGRLGLSRIGIRIRKTACAFAISCKFGIDNHVVLDEYTVMPLLLFPPECHSSSTGT